MIRVVIGTEDAQNIAQKVLEYTIRKHTKHPVEVLPMRQKHARKGGTNFGFVRFCIPEHYGYEGKAIYMDADQLVFTDVIGLLDSLDDAHDVALVKNAEGTFGEKPVSQVNQTSVMVLNCAKLKDWVPDKIFSQVVENRETPGPGQMIYRDFMMLKWIDQNRIQALDPRWNHFNIYREDTKLIHFSYVRTQPWKMPSHPLTNLWRQWLRRAIHDGFIKRREIVAEVIKRHIHPRFLADIFLA